jgi:hypothetical protein
MCTSILSGKGRKRWEVIVDAVGAGICFFVWFPRSFVLRI